MVIVLNCSKLISTLTITCDEGSEVEVRFKGFGTPKMKQKIDRYQHYTIRP